MSTINDGGSAFPVIDGVWKTDSGGHPSFSAQYESTGMSLRAYFAGQAMIGILAYPTSNWDPKSVAINAVHFADALIAELQKS